MIKIINLFLSLDWAGDFSASSDAPKSTSEARQHDEETPPPLPTKIKAYQEEGNTLPRSSKVVLTSSPPNGSANSVNENSNAVDKPTPLPRLKAVAISQVSLRIGNLEHLRAADLLNSNKSTAVTNL